MDETLVWIGVRESDIDDARTLFHKSITIHGSGQNGNISMEHELGKRYNHNSEVLDYDCFFQKAMLEILETEPDSRFVPYDSWDSKDFSDDLKRKIAFANSYELLDFLNDKISHKLWAEQYVNILPYQLFPADGLTESALRNAFPDSRRLVVQRRYSCGGEGTYFISMDGESFPKFLPNDAEICMVTEFQENNVPVNVHAVIYEEEVLLFPPSIQLISCEAHRLEYIGSDFSVFKELQEEEQTLVRRTAKKICDALRTKGYLGVCGIDMILADGYCYFMEVNGRFQASSALLNRDLTKGGFPTLQVYHIDAFSHRTPSLQEPPVTANGSKITYSYQLQNQMELQWFHRKLSRSMDFDMCNDALSWDLQFESGSYLYQLCSDQAISSVTYQHTIRLHPNMKICSYKLEKSYTYTNLLKIKVLLLTRGVSISPEVWQVIQDQGGADWEEFGAVTLKLFDDVWITSSCFDKWYTLSPMEIDYDSVSGQTFLSYYGRQLFPVEVMKADPYGGKKTKNGHFLKDIVYMNPDRLRVYHRNGCAFQDIGIGCKFCDLYGVEEPFDFREICEAVSYYFDDDRVKHYLIGGGSELANNQYDRILAIAKYLHENSDKHIYLMSQPINDWNILEELKSCGITEVSFNIEMFDRAIAQSVMPGKGRNTLQRYYDSLAMAVKLWGNTGNVRSAILLGFDDIRKFEQGVRELCELGVTPILSVFHPCAGTPLENFMPLDEKDTLLYYETAKSVCDEFGMKLGPSCKACQNNAIVLDIAYS